MIQILSFLPRHCSQVARLHLDYLRSNFAGFPGRRLLCAYYRAVARGQGACGYVAEDQGQVVGYVCGVWQPELVRLCLLKNYWLELGVWGILQLLVSPTLLVATASQILTSSKEAAGTGYELRPIVVALPARGTSVATHLTSTMLADARQRGFARIFLYVERDNRLAQSFYQKVGFQNVGTLQRAGAVYLRYEREVGGRK